MTWSNLDREARFYGTPATSATPFELVLYDEATNTWSNGPLSPDGATLGHGYDQNAGDVYNGVHYWRPYGSNQIYRYTKASGWSALSGTPTGTPQVASAIEFFPDINSLIYVDPWIGVWAYDEGVDSWSQISTSVMSGTDYHNFAVYSPVHKVVLFGGGNGSSNVWTLDVDGNITQKTNAPISMPIHSALITVDPVSGDFLVMQKPSGNWWSYNPNTDTWSSFSLNIPFADGWNVIVTPVAEYNSILLVSATGTGASATVHVYRHS
jgi:hypothetical protein